MMRLSKIGCCLGQSVLHSKGMMPSIKQVRCLFSRQELGILGYEEARQDVQHFVLNKSEYKKNFGKKFMNKDCDLKNYENGLKDLILIFENDQNDIRLLRDALKTLIQKQKAFSHIKKYNFGTVLMRAFYYFNLPNVAMEFFEGEILNQLFYQVTAYQILLDLLYENERYTDVLYIYDKLNKNGRLHTQVRYIDVIVLATYYRVNTPESLKNAITLWNKIDFKGKHQFRKSRSFVAGLALKQNQPELALDILENDTDSMYVTLRQIQLLAWAKTGQIDHIFRMMYTILKRDEDCLKRHLTSIHVLNDIEKYIQRTASQEQIMEFVTLRNRMEATELITRKTFDELILEPFPPMPPGNKFFKKN